MRTCLLTAQQGRLRTKCKHVIRKISRICGIDEAGRGAVLGPLVVCSFAAADTLQNDLKLMGLLFVSVCVLNTLPIKYAYSCKHL